MQGKKDFIDLTDDMATGSSPNLSPVAKKRPASKISQSNEKRRKTTPSPNSVSITIDSNEKFLLGIIDTLYPDEPKQNLKKDILPVGDIVFYVNEEPCLIIERKDVNDLVASISDARLWSQRARLIDTRNKNPGVIPALLVEGDLETLPYDDYAKLTKEGLKKILDSFSYEYAIPVLYTPNIYDTIRLISRIEFKFSKNGNPVNKYKEIDVANSMYIGSKKPNDGKSFGYSALALVKGVSMDMAKSIMEKYKSIADLMDVYMTTSEDKMRRNLLIGIQYQTISGKTRKVGKITSERIYCYLFNIDTNNK